LKYIWGGKYEEISKFKPFAKKSLGTAPGYYF
jgi:hypothetical protein